MDAPGQVIKVCFYGPESTGKSTMAREMANRFHTVYVPEVSREMLDSNAFTLHDIERVGRAQTARILNSVGQANRLLICDTDIITTRIYSIHYLGTAPSILDDFEKQITFDRYYLFNIDVPWVADGLRDLGNERETMMAKFRDALRLRKITPIEVTGNYTERTELIEADLRALLAGN